MPLMKILGRKSKKMRENGNEEGKVGRKRKRPKTHG
jgi:hypothetical protein